MTIWFTSDQHYNHSNIIIYCQRPFSSIEEMNEGLVSGHNDRVMPEDIVYHVGDFSLSEKITAQYLPRLNGIHHLIFGNHDSPHPTHKKKVGAIQRYLDYGFASVQESLRLTFPNLGQVLINHMPLRPDSTGTDEDQRYLKGRPELLPEDDWLLCGHVHEKFKMKGSMINVGVDVWGYKPVNIEELGQLTGKI